MSRTALDIITNAMRKAGIITAVESPTADEATDGLQTLNDVLASLSNDGLLVYANTTENFPITGGTGSYTMGSGGDFDTARPLSILSMYAKDSGGTDYPLKKLGAAEYGRLSTKTISGRPQYYYHDNGYTTINISLYPVPESDYTLYINSQKPLTSYAALTTSFDLPPGWALFIVDALAISLSPEYGAPTPQETLLSYERGLSGIKSQKAKQISLDSPPPVRERTIYTGYF